MAFEAPLRPRGPIRAILSSTALLSFTSVRKAAALAVPQLGMAAFFIAGPVRSALGESAVWFVATATVLAAFARASEIEGWALFIPGGRWAAFDRHSALGWREPRLPRLSWTVCC